MFGDKLRALRKAHGMSQPELARRLGVTKQAVSNWENNNIMPSVDMVKKLSRVLNVSIGIFFDEEEKYISVDGLTQDQVMQIQFLINAMKRQRV